MKLAAPAWSVPTAGSTGSLVFEAVAGDIPHPEDVFPGLSS